MKHKESEFKNSCPGCGYFTLMGRGNYDICPICFWEDEGFDDTDLNRESEANPHTLVEHREHIENLISEILKGTYKPDDVKNHVKEQILAIDKLMNNFNETRRRDLITEQGKLIALFTYNNIFGLEGLMK